MPAAQKRASASARGIPPEAFLARILARKREEVAALARRSPSEWRARCADQPPCRGFARALAEGPRIGGSAVIAEIKRASPSQGVLRADYRPAAIAADYAAHGACCLSVLTDAAFFGGKPADLRAARARCALPTLRKDFVIDRAQLYETRLMGADCALLIVAAMDSDGQLRELAGEARDIGLDVLVEVHDRAELERALALDTRLVGINNRDLRSFELRLDTTWQLVADVPPGWLAVTESGIRQRADVHAMRERGLRAFLVGEAMMRSESPGAALAALFA